MTDDLQLDRLRELATAATPGKRHVGYKHWGEADVYLEGGDPKGTLLNGKPVTELTRDLPPEDARYIAATSPDVLLRLLDRLEAAERERDEARDLLKMCRDARQEANRRHTKCSALVAELRQDLEKQRDAAALAKREGEWRTVPVEPTSEMIERAVYAQEPQQGANRGGRNNVNRLRRRAVRIYRAMVLWASSTEIAPAQGDERMRG